MKSKHACLLAFPLLFGILSLAQAPVDKPLAEYDKLVSQLKSNSVLGQPIHAGGTAIIPFSSVTFGLVSGDAKIASGGGLTSKNVPLGFLIVEGDDVKVEFLNEPKDNASVGHQLLQAILDRKVVFIGNGLNIGNAGGTLQDLAPLVANLGKLIAEGSVTTMGNGLNLGSVTPPKGEATTTEADPKPTQLKNPR
ncbi:MAG TPA: spore germination protein GerW family protein [Terriglobales bacterium]|nr:spore germination protein GerW family protein [Terriglobales bacterium]